MTHIDLYPFQLVLREHIEEGGREAPPGRRERSRHLPSPSFRTQSQRVLPVREGLGGTKGMPREALQDQTAGQRRFLHFHQQDVPLAIRIGQRLYQ